MLPELAALASRQLRADGIPSDSLCIVSGALDGIARVLEARLRPGDRVAVENPGYAAMFDLLRARGLGLEPVAVDERGMRPGELRARDRARRERGDHHPARAESHRRRAGRRARAASSRRAHRAPDGS